MEILEPVSISDFYEKKVNWMPDNLKGGMGHFNVFRIDDFVGPCARHIPYSRKDFYKISLMIGHNRIHYADKIVETKERALLFANPLIPYDWEPVSEEQSGFFCIFTEAFFNQFGHIRDYPVFKPGGTPIFTLNEEQADSLLQVYHKMMGEISSDYVYKYDVLRNLVLDLVHQAQRIQPTLSMYTTQNASARIASLFTELLERQFPIESPVQQVKLRSANEFAGQLAVHVNHLNRALKDITGKTTSRHIAERIAQEARALLKHTNWSISEIGYSLGFEEPAHFINFFKKNTQLTPKIFRG
ncbi:MAG: helix-turn-helix transcriptional regulator [Mucilaginibacter polytrichastri]|nr:helix-turn-helix transcriptional regulator [Mucilaginibacter polytrichastri]